MVFVSALLVFVFTLLSLSPSSLQSTDASVLIILTTQARSLRTSHSTVMELGEDATLTASRANEDLRQWLHLALAVIMQSVAASYRK
jgi:hypothetical protein